ncbi:MAG: methyltransferase domain-containing protein [Streptosporangiales bacterium]|nr:methyltransferase domain-containing protein [Streptosporangiales bacterium]
MLDYDEEAANYDRTRGGDARAGLAAAALERLLPQGPAVLADLACGTGIITTRLRRPGRRVLGIDPSAGMARLAAPRLDGAVVLGDGTRLPLPDASVDAVTTVWLLHLLDEAGSAAVIAEAARVLRPGGTFVTTVDRLGAPYNTGCDAAALIGPVRAPHVRPQTDAPERVVRVAAAHGLTSSGRATFTMPGQGRSPRVWRERIGARDGGWAGRADAAAIAALTDGLAALPDQDRPRPDPVHTLVALTKDA